MIGHIPERLARILTVMLVDGQKRRINGWIAGPEWPAPEGVWRRYRTSVQQGHKIFIQKLKGLKYTRFKDVQTVYV